MTTTTQVWNGRPHYSVECSCGYHSNWTASKETHDRKATAHAKKCAQAKGKS